MLRQKREKQQKMNLVIMEQLVPEDHFLRKVDKAVDFSFIYELCAPLYCADNGRPAIDPEILFRMLLVGYLYGIKSEARLEEEINYKPGLSGLLPFGWRSEGRTVVLSIWMMEAIQHTKSLPASPIQSGIIPWIA